MRVATLVLSIIGFVFSIPNTLCVSACAGLAGGAMQAMSDVDPGAAAAGAGGLAAFLIGSSTLVFVICLAAFILGFFAYSKPKTTIAMIAGIVLLIAGLTQLGYVLLGGILGLFAGICLILAGIFAFLAKPQEQAPAPAQSS